MQEIAKGQKGIVSEVIFCAPLDIGLYSLKYYSSECEVKFCGHGTIACMYDLIKNEPALLNKKTVIIHTRRGDLPVINDIANSDSVFITAPVPEYLDFKMSVDEIAQNLNILVESIDQNYPVSLINGGLRTLLVPIKSLNRIVNILPKQSTLEGFCRNNDIEIILVSSSEVSKNVNSFRTRVFAPKFGYLEDPATGSGNSAFGYYLLQKKVWDGEIISIEQGPNLDYPNIVKLKATSVDGVQRVLFGGNAVVKYIENSDNNGQGYIIGKFPMVQIRLSITLVKRRCLRKIPTILTGY